ncbi:hypothetical protein BT69DRAFT_1353862 [Atractiella rhizophila]|nr:hypothetical protein BT69DRAFT_1353862 [Atractiella rhizophila]
MADPTTTVTIPTQILFLDKVLSDTRVYLTAVVAVYVWEYIITFHMEYSKMWKAERWTPVRFVFFFNRYWGIGLAVLLMVTLWTEIPAGKCKHLHFIQPVWGLLLVVSNEFLLGARVYAIWNQNKRIAYGLGTLSFTAAAVKIFISVQDKPVPIPDGFGLKGCISNAGVSYMWARLSISFFPRPPTLVLWALPLLYDTVVFSLTLVPLYKYYKTGGRTPLLEAFLRDGAIFFAVSVAVNVVNLVYFLVPGVTNNAFNTPLALIVATMMAARVVLNLRAPQYRMHNSSSHAGLPPSIFNTSNRGHETGIGTQKDYPLTAVQAPPAHVLQDLKSGDRVMVNIQRRMEDDQLEFEQKQWKHDSSP